MCSADATSKEDIKGTKRQLQSGPPSNNANDSRAKSTVRGCQGGNSNTNNISNNSGSSNKRGSSRIKKLVFGGAPVTKARTVSSSSSDGLLCSTNDFSTTTNASPVSHDDNREGYEDFREPFMELIDIVQGMEADIALLKTANKQQANELGDLRSKNKQLEQAHAHMTKSHQSFSSSVLANLEQVGSAIAQALQQARQMDTRVEGYMDSIERMADSVGDRLHRLNLRTETLAAGVESVRSTALAARHGVRQVMDESDGFADVINTYTTRIKRETDKREAELRREIDDVNERMLSKNKEMTVAFEALIQLVSEEGHPAPPSPQLNAMRLTSPSSTKSQYTSLGTVEREHQPEEDGPSMASPSSSATSSATSFTLSDGSDDSIFEVGKSTTAAASKDGFEATITNAFPSTASSDGDHLCAGVDSTASLTAGGHGNDL